MAFEEPAKSRCTVEETPDALTINIPSKRRWVLVIFLGVWLCVWVIGLVDALLDAWWGNGFTIGAGLFLLVWVGLWTTFGLFAIYALLWHIAGRQVVTVGVDGIRIENVVPMWRRGKDYRLTDVQALRVAQEHLTFWTWAEAIRFWGVGRGPLAFDYGAKTVRFGPGTDEAEAKMILAVIARRCPRICQTGQSAQ